MLKVENLIAGYYKSTPVLEGVNMDLPNGQVHGIVGANGSGKTTLLQCIHGTIKKVQGEILYNGMPIKREDVSFLETDNYFYKRITGKEYLQLFGAFNKDFDVLGWNALFSLPLDKMVDDYSTGMKKKIAFLSVLSFNTPIVILDEPFNGIDMETVQLIKVIIKKLRASGLTVVVTSHILESLLNICDTISYVKGKKIEATFYPPDFASIESRVFDIDSNGGGVIVDKLLKLK
ncbi:ATP-binding cassette domain-containing protein [Sphingobacterium haloxyli]|uniref:ABC transporter domain-containing protein n=1 Tax=Sphingobacterium haloxyli TaxID=2100533 RepID=A0A2S9J039_9SPHI|nr:ATP-binding cassette domain-containing protein [Sphingobacterium haloxyli]PRD46145.1 hypothetical protein C5745_17135 [Sphingobacterium haloxyli]